MNSLTVLKEQRSTNTSGARDIADRLVGLISTFCPIWSSCFEKSKTPAVRELL